MNDPNQLLFTCAKTGDKTALKKLNHPNLNYQDADGLTALMIAARWSKDKICKFLLKHGADPNLKDNAGKNALHYAARWANPQTVEVLLKSVDINAKNKYGDTPLILASAYTNAGSSSATMELLLKNGAQVNDCDNDGWTALMSAVRNNCEDAVKILVGAKADLNIQDTIGMTALSIALKFIDECSENILKCLLQAKPNVNIRNNAGVSPLQLAATFTNERIVKILLMLGATHTERDLETCYQLKKIMEK